MPYRWPVLRSAIRPCPHLRSRARETCCRGCRKPAPRLRGDSGTSAKHAGAHRNARGAGAEGTHPGHRKRRVAAGMAPWLEMIADENRIKSALLGENGEIEQFVRSELLSGCLVAQSQRHSAFFRLQPAAATAAGSSGIS